MKQEQWDGIRNELDPPITNLLSDLVRKLRSDVSPRVSGFHTIEDISKELEDLLPDNKKAEFHDHENRLSTLLVIRQAIYIILCIGFFLGLGFFLNSIWSSIGSPESRLTPYTPNGEVRMPPNAEGSDMWGKTKESALRRLNVFRVTKSNGDLLFIRMNGNQLTGNGVSISEDGVVTFINDPRKAQMVRQYFP